MTGHSVPGRSRWHILVVGIGPRPGRVLRACLRKAVSQSDSLSIEHVDRLPSVGLDRYAAILVDARVSEAERDRLARAPDLAWRSRTVLDLNACRPEWVWQQMRAGALPAIAVGLPGEEHQLQEELARLLLADPVLKHLEPAIETLCSDHQRVLVTAFFQCTNARMPHDVARALARAPRSLSRDCAAVGLNSPQVLVKVARISRGLTLAVLQERTIDAAARIAGYHHSSSFRKAARNTFDLSASVLLHDWTDIRKLEARFKRVLFRRE